MGLKQLPVHMNPGFETECYHNFRLSIIQSEPARTSWCFNHFVNLQIAPVDKMSFPFVRFEEHLDIYSGLLTENQVQASGKEWISTIRDAIDQDDYILLYLNWRYIESSNFYKGADMIHDAIIYGYNDEEQMLDLLAFEVNGKSYGPFRISYAKCELEYARVMKDHLQANIWFAYYGFPMTTVRVNRTVDLSYDSRKLYFALERGKVRSQGDKGEAFANGYFVNEHMAAYFAARAGDRNIDPREYGIWNIVVAKMLQHKKWMLRRLEYLLHVHHEDDIRLLQKSIALYEKAKLKLINVRLDSYKYQKTSEAHYLAQISEYFHFIFEQEKRAVPLLMEHLIHAKLGFGFNQKQEKGGRNDESH